MNRLILQFFQEGSYFEDSLILSENPRSWEECIQLCPTLPRSWYELSKLSVEDRIDFTKQFWFKSFPYHPLLYKGIESFFDKVNDVGPILILDKGWSVKFLYSLKDDSTFFCGSLPAKTSEIVELEGKLLFPFPASWKSFMKIHNGFGKLLDSGILSLNKLEDAKAKILKIAMQHPIHSGQFCLDADLLFPFYEISGLNAFHCFLAEWFPEGEIGTVYFSGIDYTISDTSIRKFREAGAYPRFGDWLVSFLEGAEMVL